MDTGYIRLHRKVQKWEWYKDGNTFRLFLHLLLNANYEDSRFMGYEIKRGQMVFGREKASGDTGITVQSIRTSLSKLKSTGEITSKSTNRFTVITICNYDEYQFLIDDTNQQINQNSNQQLTSNQPATNHIKEFNNNNNKLINTRGPSSFECPEHLRDLWPDYMITRRNKKAAKTDSALRRIIKKLEKLAPNDFEKQHEILQKSVDSGWIDVYALKEDHQKQHKSGVDLYLEMKARGEEI